MTDKDKEIALLDFIRSGELRSYKSNIDVAKIYMVTHYGEFEITLEAGFLSEECRSELYRLIREKLDRRFI